MDRKSIIILAACFAAFILWMQLVPKLAPPPPSTGSSATNATTDMITAPESNTSAAPATAEASASAAIMQPPVVSVSDAPEELLEVTNENAHYTFTSRGGGLKTIELLKYPDTVTRTGAGSTRTNQVATLNALAPVPILTLLGGEALRGDGSFKLTRIEAGVRAEKLLTNGLALVKVFHISTNYLVDATIRLQNSSSQSLTLPAQEWVVGTATPMGADDTGLTVGMTWYDGAALHAEANRAWFDNTSFLSCLGMAARQPRAEYRAGASNVVWAAVQNQFFALAAMPKEPAPQVVARPAELPRPDSWQEHARTRNAPPPKGYQTAFLYPAVTLSAGQTVERQFSFFAGPKEYRTLTHISGAINNNNLDLIMGFGGFFGFFAKALLLSMNWLHDLLGLGYGWIIILITFIIKLVFWPLTQASTRSMKRMQMLQPQMKAIQEKYKDEPAKMNKKTMEFMKEHKVNPMGGCLPMAIQLPIFFGFYRMIQSAIELRGASFLWVRDLSKPDTLFFVPGLDLPFNLLPLIMGGTMLWQSHLTPPSPGMDPTQQKIMRYMPLMFLFILYNYSTGLTLYWTVQNLLTIAQMKLTKAQSGTSAGLAMPSASLAPKKKK